MTGLNPLALEALKNNQRQLDMDGCEVGVSRQALDETISAYETLRDALEKIADAPAWGAPERWETTPAEVRQLARTALGKEA